MASMQIVIFASIFLVAAFASGAPPRCSEGQSCAAQDKPRFGGAMIQKTVTDKDAAATSEVRDMKKKAEEKIGLVAKSKGMPLKGRVATLGTEIAALKEKVVKMEAEVGVVGGGGGGAAPAALATTAEEPAAFVSSVSTHESDDDPLWELHEGLDPPHHSTPKKAHEAQWTAVSLLDTQRGDDLKSLVAAAEADVAQLKGQLSTLENQVFGSFNPLASGASLLQKAEGSSLNARIISLEETVDALRSRVSNVEHIVQG